MLGSATQHLTVNGQAGLDVINLLILWIHQMCWPYFFSISSYLNLTLLPEECLFSLRKNAFEKDFFFKDEVMSENSTAAISLLIVLISFLSFLQSSLQ